MKRLLLALALTATTALARTPASAGPGMLVDSYAALVNRKVITVGQVLAALQPAQERLSLEYDGVELRDKLRAEYETARDAFIEAELILLDFETQGGQLPDRAVEDHINRVIHDRFNNNRSAFLQALSAERLTFAEWRQQMKEQLIVQILRQREVYAKIVVTPLDLQRAYNDRRAEFRIPERVRIRTLALPAGGGDPAAVRDALRSGATPFDGTAAEGASLDEPAEPLEVTSISPVFRGALAGLGPGGVSEPLTIEGRTYFIQLLEHFPAREQSLDEVAPQLEKELRQAEFKRLNRIWMDSLRAKYFVQVFSHSLFE